MSGSAVIRLGLPLYQAIPNYFVGVGLLFTFIGLIAGLYFASSGVTNPKIEIAQQAFSDLLNAATIKFMTSIAGLASSILLSINLKSQTVPITATADKFTLAAGRMDATSQQMGRAFDQIEKLGTALTDTGDRFRDSSKLYQLGTAELDEKLGRIFAAMTNTMEPYLLRPRSIPLAFKTLGFGSQKLFLG